jgi:hypothetical protein
MLADGQLRLSARRAFCQPLKLGADGGIGDDISKPKWMRWLTYDRKLGEIANAITSVRLPAAKIVSVSDLSNADP